LEGRGAGDVDNDDVEPGSVHCGLVQGAFHSPQGIGEVEILFYPRARPERCDHARIENSDEADLHAGHLLDDEGLQWWNESAVAGRMVFGAVEDVAREQGEIQLTGYVLEALYSGRQFMIGKAERRYVHQVQDLDGGLKNEIVGNQRPLPGVAGIEVQDPTRVLLANDIEIALQPVCPAFDAVPLNPAVEVVRRHYSDRDHALVLGRNCRGQ
jgi:hypothetical protein